MQENKQRYFQFSKRERRGIYILLCGIVIVFSAPSWLRFIIPQKHHEPVAISELPVMIIDSSGERNYSKSYSKTYAKRGYDEFDDPPETPAQPASLFYFDPNTISIQQWEQLGVRTKTAQTIQNYLSKGGRFRKPEDIGNIFGLAGKDVQRLLPYVQIAGEPAAEKTSSGNTAFAYNNNYPEKFPSSKNSNLMLNINTADTIQWKLLIGIGPGYAKRIVNYRNKLGGFQSVDQVAETYGLPDSVFKKIKQQLVFEAGAIQKININTATPEILFAHPYINKNLGNLIVSYREQHGPYKTVEELKKLALVTEGIYLKISAYLTTK